MVSPAARGEKRDEGIERRCLLAARGKNERRGVREGVEIGPTWQLGLDGNRWAAGKG